MGVYDSAEARGRRVNTSYSGAVHITAENAALFQQLGLPLILICRETELSKTLLKPEEFGKAGFSLSCGQTTF